MQRHAGRRWMPLGDKPLIFKVDPLSTGSDALVVGTEEVPPGNKTPTHKHLHEDEVIFVRKGAVRVTLAGRDSRPATGKPEIDSRLTSRSPVRAPRTKLSSPPSGLIFFIFPVETPLPSPSSQ
jgi:Cupin domain